MSVCLKVTATDSAAVEHAPPEIWIAGTLAVNSAIGSPREVRPASSPAPVETTSQAPLVERLVAGIPATLSGSWTMVKLNLTVNVSPPEEAVTVILAVLSACSALAGLAMSSGISIMPVVPPITMVLAALPSLPLFSVSIPPFVSSSPVRFIAPPGSSWSDAMVKVVEPTGNALDISSLTSIVLSTSALERVRM